MAGVFGLALAALWIRTVAGVVAAPVSAAWMNRQLEPGVRATVLSMESQTNAIGQVAGGPILGWVGSAVSIRAALLASAAVLSPVVVLYARIKEAPVASGPVDRTERPQARASGHRCGREDPLERGIDVGIDVPS